MGRVYNVIDSDGHILEPLTLWDDYMDPSFRHRAPKLVKDKDGKERLLVEEQILGSQQGMGGIGGVGARQGVVSAETMSYEEGRPGGFDPHKRIPDMDLDGIDAAFLYPSMGLFAGAVHDPALAGVLCRAYNRWLADYCKPYPDRLFGIAMLPLQSVDHAIEEMRFAREELGFRGGFIRPNPYNNRMLHDPAYEPFWNAAEELDLAIGIHEGGNSGMPTVGIDRFEGRGAQHIISHTMEMMLACMSRSGVGCASAIRRCAPGSSNRAAAGSRLGSIAWTAISTTRVSTIPDSRRVRASSSSAIAGSPSSRSKEASRCWRNISGRTRSYGRPTIRTATAFSRARPR